MRTRLLFAVVILAPFAQQVLIAQASQQNQVVFYVAIEGARQGRFKGESEKEHAREKLEGVKFSYEVKSPADARTGQSTGRRQHSPVTITKAWGAATPQIFQAIVTDEVLKSVVMEFVRTSRDGAEEVFHTVKLTNARVSDIRQYSESQQTLEDVSFTFEKIEISNLIAHTNASDDWGRQR